MAGRGRKPLYSEERAERVFAAIRVGATERLACKYAGISEDTLGRWKTNNADFADRFKTAEGEAAIGWLSVIEAASKTQWQAAAWKLERRYPADYSIQAQLNIAHSGEVMTTDATARERIASRIDELAERRRSRGDARPVDRIRGEAP
jgi:transposase